MAKCGYEPEPLFEMDFCPVAVVHALHGHGGVGSPEGSGLGGVEHCDRRSPAGMRVDETLPPLDFVAFP